MLLCFSPESLNLVFLSVQGTNFNGSSGKYSIVRLVGSLTVDVAGEIDNVEVWDLELLPHFIKEHLIFMQFFRVPLSPVVTEGVYVYFSCVRSTGECRYRFFSFCK